MFTVIICGKTVKKDCNEKYSEFLVPFIKNEHFAFCEWNPSGRTLDEAVPELKEIIRNKMKWRALVVLDNETYGNENISKRNPYNYIDVTNKINPINSVEEIQAFREEWNKKLNLAVENPLVRLGMWLSGAPSTEYPDNNPEYETLPDITDETYFSELRARKLQAAEVELDYLLVKKGKILAQNFTLEGEMQVKPTEIIALSERVYINENEECNSAWKIDQEHAYSRFYEDNLYSDKMFCLVCNVNYVNGARIDKSYFRFLILMLLLADNDIRNSGIRHDKLYNVKLNLDQRAMNVNCCNYLGKLGATISLIRRIKKQTNALQQSPLDRETFEELFISDAYVPVEISREFDTKKLYCKYDKLGYSTDCPSDEYDYWDGQYRKIEKEFIRYIREPKRSVKKAIQVDFRKQSSIDDTRANALNEFQREDVQIRLADEEEAMVNTRVARLFKTKEYIDRLEKADRSIKKNISQRMTKKKTLITAGLSILAFALGLSPVFFSTVNSVSSFSFSMLVVFGTLTIFALCGFCCLWVYKKRLKDRFVHFNFEMSDILKDIQDGLADFSKYLSHTDNVMREFSVLKSVDDGKNKTLGILSKHEYFIIYQMQKAQELFYNGIELDSSVASQQDPYDYDFTCDSSYDYSILSVTKKGYGRFMNNGNQIEFPADYIESVDITREELYD